MSLDADLIVDRRRMRRKLTFWRVVAIAVIVLAIAGSAELWSRRAGFADAGAYIARVTIRGLIRDDDERVQQLERLAQSSTARAVVVHVDSPGGTTAGSEQLYDALMRLKEKKPLVIVVESMAASGAYITALAGDHIVAKQTSLVGSIGVLFQYPNVSDLLDKVGVKVETIKSSPLKAVPNGFEPTSPEARAAIESIVMDSYAWFRGLVQDAPAARRRGARPRGRRPRVHRAARASTSSWSTRSATRGPRSPGWRRRRTSTPSCRCGTDKLHSRFGDLPFLHAAAVLLRRFRPHHPRPEHRRIGRGAGDRAAQS